jgi:hypothetical protein
MRSHIITPKKVRSDAILKGLREDKQDSILEYWQTHSAKQPVQWLKDAGITTSIRALSLFRAWYLLRKKYEERETRILDKAECFKKRDPSLTNEFLTEMGEYMFNEIAIDQEDIKTWSVAQQVQLRRGSLALQLQKYEDQIAQVKEKMNDTDLTPEEREQAVNQILGIS